MSITTGKAPLTAMTLTAILSLSLIVNLPGLAVSPMLSTLSTIFPSTTQLEKQLLTLLPNLVIIPFVLLSGKLSLSTHKVAVIILSLVIFTGAGVAYLFAKSMVALIVISCVLGLGAGLLTPFCTGLLADTFAGRYRMNMMGIQSGVSNIALVIGTYAVGWLSGVNWHLPFVVYLVSIIPLIFSFKLGGIPKQDLMAPRLTAAQENDPKNDKATEYSPIPGEKVVNGFYIGRTVQMVASYFFHHLRCDDDYVLCVICGAKIPLARLRLWHYHIALLPLHLPAGILPRTNRKTDERVNHYHLHLYHGDRDGADGIFARSVEPLLGFGLGGLGLWGVPAFGL